jgi:hypothetical protein
MQAIVTPIHGLSRSQMPHEAALYLCASSLHSSVLVALAALCCIVLTCIVLLCHRFLLLLTHHGKLCCLWLGGASLLAFAASRSNTVPLKETNKCQLGSMTTYCRRYIFAPRLFRKRPFRSTRLPASFDNAGPTFSLTHACSARAAFAAKWVDGAAARLWAGDHYAVQCNRKFFLDLIC